MISPAFPVLSFVRVCLLSIQTSVILDILECKVHETALAAGVTVTCGAIDEDLLTQQFSGIVGPQELQLKRMTSMNRIGPDS